MRLVIVVSLAAAIGAASPSVAQESIFGGLFPSSLQKAIKRGLAPGGDLVDELDTLEDYTISSRGDAQAIVAALKKLPDARFEKKEGMSPLFALAALFPDVDGRDSPAYEELQTRGIPELIRIFDATKGTVKDEDADDLLYVLKILAMYHTRDGSQKVIEAARRPLAPEDYLWGPILLQFDDDHPETDVVFRALRSPIPEKNIGAAFLDAANNEAIEGNLDDHPFDTPVGREQLKAWLTATDPDKADDAQSAAVGLAFIHGAELDGLLELAIKHSDVDVQMEGAWAAAKRGRQIGWDTLVAFCRNVSHSSTAQDYLKELEREDLIPKEVLEPAFKAKAVFADWLAHPNELDKAPDELEIVDQRTMYWPPDEEEKECFVIKYVSKDPNGLKKDDVDCGVVGPQTWCFFDGNMYQRPPEDVYAIHCAWELEHAELLAPKQVEVAARYAPMLTQWKGEALEGATVTHSVTIASELKYPQHRVAVATASLGGKPGWVVLDGPRSLFYAKSDFPDEESPSQILRIHLGRNMLKFKSAPDRAKYVANKVPDRDPQEVVTAYERLLAELKTANEARQKELLADWQSPLGESFVAYAEAREKVAGRPKAETVYELYQQLLKAVEKASPELKKEAIDDSGIFQDNFEEFASAAVSAGKLAELKAIVAEFEPYWEHNYGYSLLGAAAFKAGDKEVAERLLLKLKKDDDVWPQFSEIALLAEIWHANGRTDEASKLLIEAMTRVVADAKEAKGSDPEHYDEQLQGHRKAYLKLFPKDEKALVDKGIPETLMPGGAAKPEAAASDKENK